MLDRGSRMTLAVQIIEATELLKSLGIALGLGLLIGLQREWTHKRMAGIRTFPLVALFGGLCGVAAGEHGGWIAAAGLIATVALTLLANLSSRRGRGARGDDADLEDQEDRVGLTTEFALLLTFTIGLVAVLGYRLEATVCAGTVMVLLQVKKALHRAIRRFGEGELREIARLVLAALVILPLLPNRDMGELGVINPFEIWLLVVLIVGVSLAAYLAAKFLGGRKGAVVSGIFGGLISSTATTVSAARRSKASPDASRAFALIAMIASAVVFGRVMVEVVLAGGEAGRPMLLPLGTMMAWMVAVSAVMARFSHVEADTSIDEDAPSEFKAAIVFALLYVAVLAGVAFAKERLGEGGLYTVAALSGLTDMDAITLSTAKLVKDQHLEASTGWRLILVGGCANLVFKALMVALIGSRRMLMPVALVFALSLAGATVLWFAWP